MSAIGTVATLGVGAIFCTAAYIIGYWSGRAESARLQADFDAAIKASKKAES